MSLIHHDELSIDVSNSEMASLIENEQEPAQFDVDGSPTTHKAAPLAAVQVAPLALPRRAMNPLRELRRENSSVMDLDNDETMKCVVSSVLFAILIFLLILMVFVVEPFRLTFLSFHERRERVRYVDLFCQRTCMCSVLRSIVATAVRWLVYGGTC